MGCLRRCLSRRIDTGMGLERIACVLQDVMSNYQTDLFTSLARPELSNSPRYYSLSI